MDVFDGFQESLSGRSQFFLYAASGPFYNFNCPGAQVSQGIIQNWRMQSMMTSFKGAYDCIKAFSETDYTEDLKKIDAPSLILHGGGRAGRSD